MAVRDRPQKQFRAVVAFGPYSKGALLSPTGIYRDTLLRKKYIEEVNDVDSAAGPALVNRTITMDSLRKRGPYGTGRRS